MIAGIATLLVLIGLGRMPYDYYMLLRTGLFAACIYFATKQKGADRKLHWPILAVVAVLYNPVAPIHLGEKGYWILVNVLTVGYFWFLQSRICPEDGTSGA